MKWIGELVQKELENKVNLNANQWGKEDDRTDDCMGKVLNMKDFICKTLCWPKSPQPSIHHLQLKIKENIGVNKSYIFNITQEEDIV